MRRRSSAARLAALLNLLRGGTEQAVEVEPREGLDAGGVREVEVERGDGDRAVGDGLEVRALLLVEAGVLAVDPVAAAAALLLGQLEPIAVDALAEPARAGPGRLLPGHVHVEQRAGRHAHPLELLNQSRRERRGGLELVAAAGPE